MAILVLTVGSTLKSHAFAAYFCRHDLADRRFDILHSTGCLGKDVAAFIAFKQAALVVCAVSYFLNGSVFLMTDIWDNGVWYVFSCREINMTTLLEESMFSSRSPVPGMLFICKFLRESIL